MEKYCRAVQATDENMGIHIAGRIPKATNTSAEYVMHIASLLQQWLHVRASTSGNT